jgi:hypothetical protein
MNFLQVTDYFHSEKDEFKQLLLDELYRNQIKIDSTSFRIYDKDFKDIVRDFRIKGQQKSTRQLPSYSVQFNLIQERSNQIEVEVQWIDLKDFKVSKKYQFPVRETREKLLQESAKRCAESLRLNLIKKVRIAIVPFTPVSPDSITAKNIPLSRYLVELNNTLSYLLGTSLAQTPWIGIVDISPEFDKTGYLLKKQQKRQRQKERLSHRYLAETAIEAGQLVFPNYILYGNLLVTENRSELRLDCWLVSIESQLVIAADGITIEDSSLNSLSKNTQGLANRLTRLIELQTALNRPPLEILGVIPSRNMEIKSHYSGRTLEIIKMINLKLKDILDQNEARLFYDYEALKRYLLPENDKNKISYDELLFHYNVDNILKINLAETDREYVASFVLESLKDPRKNPWYSETHNGDVVDLDEGINDLIREMIQEDKNQDFAFLFKSFQLQSDTLIKFHKSDTLGENPDTKSLSDCLNNGKIPQSFKNYYLSFNLGQISRWSDNSKKQFFNNGANRLWVFAIDIRLPKFFFSWHNWGIGGIGGWDKGGTIQDFEIKAEYPELDSVEIGDITIQEWFLSVYISKYLPWQNFELSFSGGPVVFFVTRTVGVGTELKTGEDRVSFGGMGMVNFKGLLIHHHKMNFLIDLRLGGIWSKMNKVEDLTHPVFDYKDVEQTFPGGVIGGWYITGGLSLNFRP